MNLNCQHHGGKSYEFYNFFVVLFLIKCHILDTYAYLPQTNFNHSAVTLQYSVSVTLVGRIEKVIIF